MLVIPINIIVRRTGALFARSRRLLASAASVALVATALPATAQDRSVVVTTAFEINSVDPSRHYCDTCQIFMPAIYEPLLGYGPDNRTIVPRLASSFSADERQTVFTFEIDARAKFADGSPVESKDVKFSMERLKSLGLAGFLMGSVQSIEAPTDKTVVVTLSYPNSEFPGIMSALQTGIMNSDVAIANGATTDPATDKAENWFLTNSAGSGKFVLQSHVVDSELRLARNPDYWGDAPAQIDAIILTQASEATAQALMLENGSADIAMQVDPVTAQTIKSPDVEVRLIESPNVIYGLIGAGAEDAKGQLTDKVRQAIVASIDFDGLVEFLADGNARKQASIFPNGFPGTTDLVLPSRDLEKAKQLLAEDGKADGVDIVATFPDENNFGIPATLMMQKIQQDLAEANIRLTLSPQASAIVHEKWEGGEGGAFGFSYLNFAPDYYGSAGYAEFFGLYPGTYTFKASRPDLAPVDASVTETPGLVKAALAASGPAAEAEFRKVAEATAAKAVVFPLINPNTVRVYNKRLAGFDCGYLYNCRLEDVRLAQ